MFPDTRHENERLTRWGEWRRLLISCGKVYRTRKRRCPDRFAWNRCLSSEAPSTVCGCHNLSDGIHGSLCKQLKVCLSQHRHKARSVEGKRTEGAPRRLAASDPMCRSPRPLGQICLSPTWPDQYWEISSARGETRIPLKRQHRRMTELTVFSYRTLKMHSGKGARKSAQLAKGCAGYWPCVLAAGWNYWHWTGQVTCFYCRIHWKQHHTLAVLFNLF